jgi:hypothetical protein
MRIARRVFSQITRSLGNSQRETCSYTILNEGVRELQGDVVGCFPARAVGWDDHQGLDPVDLLQRHRGQLVSSFDGGSIYTGAWAGSSHERPHLWQG